MPTYEYKCTQDGSTFDIWQEVGSEPPPCPTCGAPTKKVFRPTRTIFKGSGFYITDTRSESGKSEGAKATSDAPKSESSGDSSADNASSAGETKAADAKPAS